MYWRFVLRLMQRLGAGRNVGDARLGPFEDVLLPLMDNARQGSGYRLIRTHNTHPLIQRAFEHGVARGVYVFRDLRDVIVSFTLREQCDHTLDDQDWIAAEVRRISANHHFWTGLGDAVLVTEYPTLLNNRARVFQATAQFLGLPLSRMEAEQYADEFAPGRMLAELPADHINDGRAGMWHYHCTPEQATFLDRVVRKYGGPTLKVLP